MFKLLISFMFSCLLSLSVNAQAEEPSAQALIEQSAQQGDAKAQARLGAMYLLGVAWKKMSNKRLNGC